MRNDNEVVFLTPAGYERLSRELEELTTKRRHEIAERIRESMEHGEFSEDHSELEEIKFEQAMIENRIAELKSVLANAQVLTPRDISTRRVGIGCKVTLVNTRTKKETVITLVSSAEADPSHNMVSNESPLGKALEGRVKGERVTVDAPAGRTTYLITKIGKAVR
ncbi:MAG: transcription elongation factor GreA [Candidatus Caldarchaeum sp.]